MSKHPHTHDGVCPDCGHIFSLAELKRMAVGDGRERHLPVILPDGQRKVVSFDEFAPNAMTPLPPTA